MCRWDQRDRNTQLVSLANQWYVYLLMTARLTWTRLYSSASVTPLLKISISQTQSVGFVVYQHILIGHDRLWSLIPHNYRSLFFEGKLVCRALGNVWMCGWGWQNAETHQWRKKKLAGLPELNWQPSLCTTELPPIMICSYTKGIFVRRSRQRPMS